MLEAMQQFKKSTTSYLTYCKNNKTTLGLEK